MSAFPITRLRRLRKNTGFRILIAETDISLEHFIYPIFISEEVSTPKEISAMPGIKQWTLSTVVKEAKRAYTLGIPPVLLFGIPSKKRQCWFAGLCKKRDYSENNSSNLIKSSRSGCRY